MQVSLNLTTSTNINSYNSINMPINNKYKTNTFYTPKPNTSFKGYNNLIVANSKRTILKTDDLTQVFSKLFESIENNPQIKKTEYFDILKDLLKNNGLKTTLSKLGNPNQKGELGKFIKYVNEYTLTLASDNSRPVFIIHSNGPHSLIDALTNSKTAKKQVILYFQDIKKEYQMGFSLDKNGNFELRKLNDNYYSYTNYHPSGNRRKEVIQHHGGNPDTTYYNKDGSKSFFKNWFFGGEATPV